MTLKQNALCCIFYVLLLFRFTVTQQSFYYTILYYNLVQKWVIVICLNFLHLTSVNLFYIRFLSIVLPQEGDKVYATGSKLQCNTDTLIPFSNLVYLCSFSLSHCGSSRSVRLTRYKGLFRNQMFVLWCMDTLEVQDTKQYWQIIKCYGNSVFGNKQWSFVGSPC